MDGERNKASSHRYLSNSAGKFISPKYFSNDKIRLLSYLNAHIIGIFYSTQLYKAANGMVTKNEGNLNK